VGATATAAAVGRLVLYHLIPGHPGVTDEAWTGMVAPHWSGPLTVGRDLLEL
jgi:ribonuclease BN (tRNA processing enzyme)